MRSTELVSGHPWSPLCMPELLRTSVRHVLSALMTLHAARVPPVAFFVFFAFFDRYVSVTRVHVEPEAHLRCSGTASWMFLHMVLVSSAVAIVLKSP